MPSHEPGARYSSVPSLSTLICTAMRVPPALTAGAARYFSSSSARCVRACCRSRTQRVVASEGLTIKRPVSASSTAASPSTTSWRSARTPTRSGTPRDRARIATWLAAPPPSSATPRQGAREELARCLRIGRFGAVDPIDLRASADDEKSVAQPGGGHLAFELSLPLRAFVEIAPDQLDDGGHCLRGVGSLGLDKECLP